MKSNSQGEMEPGILIAGLFDRVNHGFDLFKLLAGLESVTFATDSLDSLCPLQGRRAKAMSDARHTGFGFQHFRADYFGLGEKQLCLECIRLFA